MKKAIEMRVPKKLPEKKLMMMMKMSTVHE